MISDTTIAAVRTQGCEMKDKFKENFLIVLPAAVITAVIFFFLAGGNAGNMDKDLEYQLIKVVPYLVVLIGALIGINVFVVLIAGTVLAAIVGVGTGAFALGEMFQKMGEGVTSMYDITVISIIVAAIVALVKEYGGIEFILNLIKKNIKGARGGEFGISLLVFLVDCCTANNTVAIVMAGPIAKEISEEFDVSPRRSASLLDNFCLCGTGNDSLRSAASYSSQSGRSVTGADYAISVLSDSYGNQCGSVYSFQKKMTFFKFYFISGKKMVYDTVVIEMSSILQEE